MIKEITKEQKYSQTLDEKLEVIRIKINEIVRAHNEAEPKHFFTEDNWPMEDTFGEATP